YEVLRTPDVAVKENAEDIILSEQQQRVYDGIASLIDEGKPCAALLYGVTGSGKTPVFAKLISHTLDLGKNVIMLIPEISLTPQVVQRFQNLFGDLVAIMHSSLSLTQRLNEYKRVKKGQARIVVGTRSAVFAPMENIGLFIIDEEGERTYKSESSPRYNAKEIAKKRCLTHGAVTLMASATPSIESYYYAQTGRYKLFTMPERYSQERLPVTEMVDLAVEGFYGNSAVFSDKLVEEINYNLEKKEQTILLLNRRGYHTYISCADCKEPLVCPNCSIPMTYHRTNGRVLCHYCGHSEEMPSSCGKCGSAHLKMTGLGTQKVEDEVASLFPNARILRMDADTTYSRYAYERSFRAFENGEYDIMLGTQMIAKGLDFPNVTLVGVLSIDKALFAGDFRSYERTFSLITQVVGRCGRGDKQGRAIIQTYVPEHYVLNLAADQNYPAFYEQEISSRQALIY
ncbi:MAG: primosomal protein N', partial [Oscillospiraceae bacterium]|nr:primosomal protein N' [Oscillospiraceae bacterium]